MGLFSFKSTPKPRRFNHVPIYWDPEKEAREEREATIEKELNPSRESTYKPSIQRGSFRKFSDRLETDKRKRMLQKQRIKLFIVLGILILIGLYLMLNSQAIYTLYFDNSL